MRSKQTWDRDLHKIKTRSQEQLGRERKNNDLDQRLRISKN